MALNLTRRIGETLMIGDDISVTVLGVKGTAVKIAIEAPKEVVILREELVGTPKKEQDNEQN